MTDGSITWRGYKLEAGGHHSGAYVGHVGTWTRGALVQVWPNGKRWDAHIDMGGSNTGRSGRGWGMSPQGAIDSAMRAAIREMEHKIGVLEELLNA